MTVFLTARFPSPGKLRSRSIVEGVSSTAGWGHRSEPSRFSREVDGSGRVRPSAA